MSMKDNKTRIFHNPRCSKSRQTLQILNEQGIQADVIEYLKEPPDFKMLQQILTMLDMGPRELLRKNEDAYKELQLDRIELSDDDLIQAMVDHPKLIERPIVIRDGKAIIGRPPQIVLEILT
jgi:arsenate reductase